MALRVKNQAGNMVEVLPSHDPDELDAMLEEELAEAKAADAAIPTSEDRRIKCARCGSDAITTNKWAGAGIYTCRACRLVWSVDELTGRRSYSPPAIPPDKDAVNPHSS